MSPRRHTQPVRSRSASSTTWATCTCSMPWPATGSSRSRSTPTISTGVPVQWIPERGDLILKHLELWSHLNNAAEYPSYTDPFGGLFTNHVDLSKISVSGHSRGGEASVSSYVRNFLRPVAQQFSIGSVSSIAPVDAQGYVLGDVPYFVILPASDCDARALAAPGSMIARARRPTRRSRAASTSTEPTMPSSTPSGLPMQGMRLAGPQRLHPGRRPAEDRRSLSAAFVRSQLLGEDVYEDMLRGRMTFPSTAGRKIYHFRTRII